MTPPKLHAGGSCGNVVAILSFLDWETYPVARLADDPASHKLINDLKTWNVRTNLISRDNSGSTPIIIQRITKNKDGYPIHKFEFRNPEDGKWLPSYKPVLSKEVENITKLAPIPKVFYFDRINRAAIEFAKYFKKFGAIIFFEPSSIGEMRLFEECLNIADIIKYSNDRIVNYSELFPKQRVALEIETIGKDGLNYRYGKNLTSTKWTHLKSFRIGGIVDAAGAGDWCSAGIISKIEEFGFNALDILSKENIEDALLYGQALGAVNCCFDGARGIMYNLDSYELNNIVTKVLQNKEFSLAILNNKKPINKTKPFKISSLLKNEKNI